jgi:putative phosphoesterase
VRIAALYDIHGNLPALEAVLRDVGRAHVDAIVIGGDVVPGPMCNECLAALSSLSIPTHYIRGNCESAVLTLLAGDDVPGIPKSARDAMGWVGEQLSSAHKQWIAAWPLTSTLPASSGTILFCHATPRDDNEIFTRLTATERVAPAFANVTAAIVICGHTHMQFDRTFGALRVVNAGSVGMPFGAVGACWALINSQVELRSTPYDLDRAAERIRASAYPQAQLFANQYVLHPPSEDQMLRMYAKVELGGHP